VRVFRFDHLDSTNTKARELAASGFGEGTVVVAITQTAGRGRGDHTWHSPKGGIYLSAVVRPNVGRRVTDLSFLAGIAVMETIRNFLTAERVISVKWPNDCLIDGKKVSGVLGEALSSSENGLAVLGIGLNANVVASELAAFEGNAFPATSLLLEGGAPVNYEVVLATLVERLFDWYERYGKDGFSVVQQHWERHCRFIGEKVRIAAGAVYREGGRTGLEPSPVTATCLGIDEYGALVLSTMQGERRHYFAGELICYSR